MRLPKHITHIIGIDEVGRGPIAGPVTVCAFIVQRANLRLIREAWDSKQLSQIKREEIFGKFAQLRKDGLCDYKVASVGPQIIDRIGIVPSIRLALNRAIYRSLNVGSPELPTSGTMVLLDGGLRAPEEWVHQKTIVKGDSKEAVIAAASIMAKVTRDAKMKKLAERYPEYGFDQHKGYGTHAHYEALKKHGHSDIHRQTFLNT